MARANFFISNNGAMCAMCAIKFPKTFRRSPRPGKKPSVRPWYHMAAQSPSNGQL
jgi:hypothetical protein